MDVAGGLKVGEGVGGGCEWELAGGDDVAGFCPGGCGGEGEFKG